MTKTQLEKARVDALNRAIRVAGGTQAKLAERMRPFAGDRRPSQALIWYWLKNKTPIDDKWWDCLERATEGQVTRRDFRPELFSENVA